MPTFPTAKTHRYSRRKLSRGEQAAISGGMFAGQNLAYTDLGFAQSRGVAVASIFMNPSTVGGLLVVGALFDNTDSPTLVVADSSGPRTITPDNGPLDIANGFVTTVSSVMVAPGACVITLAAPMGHSAALSMRAGIITSLAFGQLDVISGAAGVGAPNSGPSTPTGPNEVAVAVVGMQNPAATTSFLGGIQNSGGPVNFSAAGSAWRLQMGKLVVLTPTALAARIAQASVKYAASLGFYK